MFVLSRLEQPRQDKNLLYQPSELNEPTKEDYLTSSHVLLGSPFASVSTVSKGQPFLHVVSLDKTEDRGGGGGAETQGVAMPVCTFSYG